MLLGCDEYRVEMEQQTRKKNQSMNNIENMNVWYFIRLEVRDDGIFIIMKCFSLPIYSLLIRTPKGFYISNGPDFELSVNDLSLHLFSISK